MPLAYSESLFYSSLGGQRAFVKELHTGQSEKEGERGGKQVVKEEDKIICLLFRMWILLSEELEYLMNVLLRLMVLFTLLTVSPAIRNIHLNLLKVHVLYPIQYDYINVAGL